MIKKEKLNEQEVKSIEENLKSQKEVEINSVIREYEDTLGY